MSLLLAPEEVEVVGATGACVVCCGGGVGSSVVDGGMVGMLATVGKKEQRIIIIF